VIRASTEYIATISWHLIARGGHSIQEDAGEELAEIVAAFIDGDRN